MLTGSRARAAAPIAILDPIGELLGGSDVVGQDEDLLREQRSGERVVVVGRFRGECSRHRSVRPQQLRYPFDDDPRLASARPGNDNERPLVPVDDPLLSDR